MYHAHKCQLQRTLRTKGLWWGRIPVGLASDASAPLHPPWRARTPPGLEGTWPRLAHHFFPSRLPSSSASHTSWLAKGRVGGQPSITSRFSPQVTSCMCRIKMAAGSALGRACGLESIFNDFTIWENAIKLTKCTICMCLFECRALWEEPSTWPHSRIYSYSYTWTDRHRGAYSSSYGEVARKH